MLVIRLSRTGRRNQPKFRLVLTEDSSKLKGKATAILGHYIPTLKEKPFVFDKEAVQMWISKGAQPSNTVAKLLNSQGFDLKVIQRAPAKPKKAPKEEAPAPKAEAAPAEPVEEAAEQPEEATPAEEPVQAEEAPAQEEPAVEPEADAGEAEA